MIPAWKRSCAANTTLIFSIIGWAGLTLLREALQRGCKAPVILLTGQDDRDLAFHALEAGAADYLVKGEIDAIVLERSIRYALEQKRNALELELKVAERTVELGEGSPGLRFRLIHGAAGPKLARRTKSTISIKWSRPGLRPRW